MARGKHWGSLCRVCVSKFISINATYQLVSTISNICRQTLVTALPMKAMLVPTDIHGKTWKRINTSCRMNVYSLYLLSKMSELI